MPAQLRHLIAAAAVASAVAAAPCTAQVLPTPQATDWDQMRAEYTADMLRTYNQLISDWRDAWTRGEAREVASLYSAHGGRLLLPGMPAVEGSGAIERWIRGGAGGIRNIRVGLVDFAASDRIVYATGPFYLEASGAGDAEPVGVEGTHTTVLVREGRRWRIRAHLFSERAPERAAPEATSGP